MCVFFIKLGTMKERITRGKTLCNNIHARSLEERVEVTFEKGQAIGPSEKNVTELSFFLGTIARNPTFCPLTYTSWKALPDDNKRRMWDYVNVSLRILYQIN